MIEHDDDFVGGKHTGKTNILVACEHNEGKQGEERRSAAMKAVERVTQENFRAFARQTIVPG